MGSLLQCRFPIASENAQVNCFHLEAQNINTAFLLEQTLLMLRSKPLGFSQCVTSSTDKNHPQSKSTCLDLDMHSKADRTGCCSHGYKKSQAKLCSTDCIMPSYCSQAFRESTALPARPAHRVNVKQRVENNRNAVKQTSACSNHLPTKAMFIHPSERLHRSFWCKSIQTLCCF